MRNVLAILAVVFAILVIVLTVYLTPDNLASCQTSPSNRSICQKADAIVAVSGGNTSIRTAEAIHLYKNGWADTLIFSGAAKDTSGPSNAEVMRDQALAAGVPAGDIAIDTLSQTTKQNAEKTKNLLVKVGSGSVKRIILVTSAYHQRRASLEFQALAGDNITVINHPAKHDPDWPAVWWLTPRGWWLAGGEIVKITAFYSGHSQ